MRHPFFSYIVCIITAVVVVVLDLWSKGYWFARETMWMGFAPLLQTIHHRNYGLMFNLPAPTWLTVGISAMVLMGVIYLFGRKISFWPTAIGLGSLIGGALGNGYDRVALGYVRDWILAFGRSAFNVADVAIAAGLLILFVTRNRKVDELP